MVVVKETVHFVWRHLKNILGAKLYKGQRNYAKINASEHKDAILKIEEEEEERTSLFGLS
jgi:hypothetical protein